MQRIDIDGAIKSHNLWRRQFMNAFAGGNYVEMPLSGHRGCTLSTDLAKINEVCKDFPELRQRAQSDERFHALANEIVELSNNGMGGTADLLLPQLTEESHQLVSMLDKLRDFLRHPRTQ